MPGQNLRWAWISAAPCYKVSGRAGSSHLPAHPALFHPGGVCFRKIERHFVNFKKAILKSKFLSLVALLLLFAPGQLRAQGIFDGFSFPTTVTATGQTEVAGAIMVILRAGTATGGNLLVDLSPLTITNTNATD